MWHLLIVAVRVVRHIAWTQNARQQPTLWTHYDSLYQTKLQERILRAAAAQMRISHTQTHYTVNPVSMQLPLHLALHHACHQLHHL